MKPRRKKPPLVTPPRANPPPPEPDRLPDAWAILALALIAMAALELADLNLPAWRQTTLWSVFNASAEVQPSAWPTPQPLLAVAAQVHTRPSDIARLFASKPGRPRPPLRIAYFADSMAEGDLITQDLRTRVQERLGGAGVGWVGMAPLDAWAREDVQQVFDANWVRRSILKPGWEGQAYGPQGSAWNIEGGKASVQFRGSRQPWYRALAPATLWYGPVAETVTASVKVTVDGVERVLSLHGAQVLNALALTDAPSQALDLEIEAPPGLDLFAVSFEQGSGVDCFSTRSSHGGPLARLDPALLKALQAQRGYGLVIAHFGINALSLSGDKSFKWYRRSLGDGLRNLQAGLAPAAMVLVSATDMAQLRNGVWASDPRLPDLLMMQEAVATDVGIPFINAFDLMGGPGSVAAWAEANPRLAEPDRVHLTLQGSKRFAEALWLALQKGGEGPRTEP